MSPGTSQETDFHVTPDFGSPTPHDVVLHAIGHGDAKLHPANAPQPSESRRRRTGIEPARDDIRRLTPVLKTGDRAS